MYLYHKYYIWYVLVKQIPTLAYFFYDQLHDQVKLKFQVNTIKFNSIGKRHFPLPKYLTVQVTSKSRKRRLLQLTDELITLPHFDRSASFDILMGSNYFAFVVKIGSIKSLQVLYCQNAYNIMSPNFRSCISRFCWQ